MVLLGSGVGALNEVAEYLAAKYLGATNVGGFDNTGRDLIANLLGGLAFGLLAARRRDITD